MGEDGRTGGRARGIYEQTTLLDDTLNERNIGCYFHTLSPCRRGWSLRMVPLGFSGRAGVGRTNVERKSEERTRVEGPQNRRPFREH